MNHIKRYFTHVPLLLLLILAGCSTSNATSEEANPPIPTATTIAQDAEVATVAEEEASASAQVAVHEENAEDSTIKVAEDADVGDDVVADAVAKDVASANEATAGEVTENSDAATSEHASGTANRLINEKSPYLLQHAYNPVDWYPWGEEAFAKAKAEDKPIFLSIGYSTCHWCHVMEKESFEDEEVAALMNDAFIAIKVDREERPDIDGIYMNVAQLMQTRGGWPLNVLLTPDQKPFFVATYIPKESRFQRAGMLDLVPQIQEVWNTRRDEILAFANEITTALQPPQMSQLADLSTADGADLLGTGTLNTAYEQLSSRFDAVNGGFGTAPKFPSPHNLLFLLRYGQRTGDEQALHMVETTLQAMRRGWCIRPDRLRLPSLFDR